MSFFINITYTFHLDVLWQLLHLLLENVPGNVDNLSTPLDACTPSAHISPPPPPSLVLSLESYLAQSLYFFSLHFLKGIIMTFFLFC